jgi:hypothetical protein
MQARWLFLTESVSDLLGEDCYALHLHSPLKISAGYEPRELVGRPSLELVHPDEYTRTKQLHL